MNNFRNLIVWKRSIALATDIYKVTINFPNIESYGLTAQIRRSSVSISSNIAEGAGRKSTRSFAHFLGISYGSACELETQILIARNLKYLNEEDFKLLYSELTKFRKCFMY